MDNATRQAAKDMILRDLDSFEKFCNEEIRLITERCEEKIELIKNLFHDVCNTKSGRLIQKTPKVVRKRIQMIPETVTESIVKNIYDNNNDTESENELLTRPKRGASVKALQKIKSQQNLPLNAKLRRPQDSKEHKTISRTRPMKRTKKSSSESDKDIGREPAKQNKRGKNLKRSWNMIIRKKPMSCTEQDDGVEPNITKEKSLSKQLSLRSSKKLSDHKNTPENSNIIEETLIDHDTTNITEPSVYEDAVGKSTIENSIITPNATVTVDKKIMNPTAVLSKMNETVPISRNSSSQNHKKLSNEPFLSVLQSKANLQHELSTLKTTMSVPQFDELITDDESFDSTIAFEKKKKHAMLTLYYKTPTNQKPKHILKSDTDDEVISSPEQPQTKLQQKYTKHLKSAQNKSVSPYVQESVKKRIEAFEKAVIDTPNDKIETTGRLIRTKTRAKNNTDAPKTPSVAAILSRKSLSKAIKIIREEKQRDHDAEKENNLLNTAQKFKVLKNDKVVQKQQLRTTPISKSRLQTPMSVSRIFQASIGNQLLPSSKATTTSRTYKNSSSTEMMSTSKPLSKSNSTDSLAEKRHRVSMEENAQRKKEEALKAQTEEKRRKREEKEQKAKLARETREKMEQEKRLELDKEERKKARHALMMQEKMREEAEKKKIAQNQRAMENEERRKRKLAEQKQQEQEIELRRQAEAQAQQLAADESTKLKLQHPGTFKQMQLKQQEAEMQGPSSYKIDSEPDDISEDESKPKYTIPLWAKAERLKPQLEMQPYIPFHVIMKFFGVKKITLNLAEVFIGIEKERLVRTSSAVWKNPPRFSMMKD